MSRRATAPPASPGLWLALGASAWLAGVACQLQQAVLWPLPNYQALVGVAMAGALGAVFLRGRGGQADHGRRSALPAWRCLGLLLVAGIFGFGTAGWRASARLADALPAALENQDVELVGVVASLPQQGAAGVRFRFDVESAAWQGRPVRVPEQVALGWFRGRDDAPLADGSLAPVRAGERWQLTARLRRPHASLNPHGYDQELQWFEQGVRATGSVRESPARRLDSAAGHPVERLRQRVRDAIDAAVADRRAAGVLAALAVGDQGAIERDDWELFRNASVAHLVSISGLHITMFAWLAGGAIAAAWRRVPRAMQACPAPTAGRWGGLVAACAYAVFSGWGVPSQRTVWMLAVVIALQTSGIVWPWLLVLLTAAVVVTAVDPWALLQAGFWLSFAAVGLLMASAPAHAPRDADAPAEATLPWWRRIAGVLGQGVRTQVVATLGLAPLTLVFFQQISLVGLAANLVAIPLVTLVITPLALLGVVAVPLWTLGSLAVDVLVAWLGWLTAWPAAVWSVAVAPAWAQAAGLLGAALLVLPLPWRLRVLGIGLLWPLLAPPVDRPAPGRFDLLAADVGQGTAVRIRTAGHVLVFDSGPQYSRESDAGQRVLLPLLRALGDERIDRLVLSHRDLDHVGGARALLDGLPVGDLLSSLEPGHPLLAYAARTERCASGQSWTWDGVRFDILRPDAADYDRTLKSNAMSCVLHVVGDAGSALLTGDVEAEQEAALVAAGGLASDVLLVPHHGSRTSSTAAFIDAVNPRVAVVQAGSHNRFGHPAPAVVARYRERGIEVVDSPRCGAWRWAGVASQGGVCERDARRRYWHDAPD